MEDDVGPVTNAELQPVIDCVLLALDALAIDECAVLAAFVDEEENPIFRNDFSVIARNPGIGDDQILVHLASHIERAVFERDQALLFSLYKYEAGKYARAGLGGELRSRCEGHAELMLLLTARRNGRS